MRLSPQYRVVVFHAPTLWGGDGRTSVWVKKEKPTRNSTWNWSARRMPWSSIPGVEAPIYPLFLFGTPNLTISQNTGHCQSVFDRNKARGGLGGRLPGSAAVLWLLFSPPQPPRMEKVSQGGSAVHKPLGWRGPEVAMVFSTQGTRKLWLFQPSWGLIVENLSRALNKFCFMIF